MNARALSARLRDTKVTPARVVGWIYGNVLPTLASHAAGAGLSRDWGKVTAHPSSENVLAFRKIALDKATEAWSYGHSYAVAAALRDVATGLADIALMLDKPVDNVAKIATRAALVARDASLGTPRIAAQAQSAAWQAFKVEDI